MAWAEKRANGRYTGLYRGADGVRRTAGTWPHKSRALREASAAEAADRLAPGPSDARLTWAQWEQRWSESRSVAKSTKYSDAQRVRTWVLPTFGNMQLRDITPEHVQRWVTRLYAMERKAPTTVAKCYRLLSASMRAAVDARLITVSPCRGIRLPAPPPHQDRYLTDDEVERILSFLSGPVEVAVRVLVGSGLRFGEMAGLHWQSVDLDRATIDVVHSWDAVGKEMKGPKTHQRRTVPVGDSLLETLRTRESSDTSCGMPHLDGGRCRSGLVVPSRANTPLNSQNVLSRDWKAACAYAGVRDARLHDLRHTYASRLVRAGVPLLQVSRLLGHGSVTTTERYAHLATSQWDSVRAVLNAGGANHLPTEGPTLRSV